MKKAVNLVIILLFSLSGFSQISDKTISEDLQKLYNSAGLAANKKDYKEAIAQYDSLISYYNNLPRKDKEELASYMGMVYYNNACYLSILNSIERALDNFGKAIEFKWNDYAHALQDSDLDNLRNENRFKELMLELKKIGDFQQILRESSDYNLELPKEKIQFTYLNASDSNLVNIRQHFNLDSIAGEGDEISQLKNLMTWVHNRVKHDGSSSNPTQKNAIDLIEVCDIQNRGINCRMMATILNECYLAMGFKSRFITCMPKDYVYDCHVINAVYSKMLDKWLWMDPTFNAYVSDEDGNLLGIAEVRERLRAGEPLILNEDANWNNQNKQTKEYYLDSYMAKNLYWLSSPLNSGYNIETNGTTGGFINLYPVGYVPDPIRNDYITTNDKLFWEEN